MALHLANSHPAWYLLKGRLEAVCEPSYPRSSEGLRDLIRDIYVLFLGTDSASKFDDIPRMLSAMPREVTEQFTRDTIPLMCFHIVQDLPLLFPDTNGQLPCLAQNRELAVSFTPADTYILVSLSFLCIPLIRADGSPAMRDSTFQFFYSNRPHMIGKLHCIVNYLNVMASARSGAFPKNLSRSLLDRRITIQRIVATTIHGAEWWAESAYTACDVEIKGNFERIESCQDAVQADFANKHIGGGVLRKGCVQEEIRFVVSPECLISVLVCESLGPHEAIIIRNTVQFNNYEGYSVSFKCRGFSQGLVDFFHDSSENPKPLRTDDILCIDAIPFGNTPDDQFEVSYIVRELEKCRVGLSFPDTKPFATGNWGCGVFGGDTQLKAVIQWLACCVAGRKMIFHPFEDKETSRLNELVSMAFIDGLTTGQLFQFILKGLLDSAIRPKSCIEYLIKQIISSRR